MLRSDLGLIIFVFKQQFKKYTLNAHGATFMLLLHYRCRDLDNFAGKYDN